MPDVGEILKTVLIVVQIVVGLGFLIFIHEAGHFLVAKWKGVRVEAFSLGMGPVIWKRTWGGTE
jgi:regulator of sigma E protease